MRLSILAPFVRFTAIAAMSLTSVGIAIVTGPEKSTALHIGKAVVTFTPRPVWPFGARIRRTTTGVFILRVRPNGSAARVDIVQSTGYQTTDLASMDVFYKWRLVPGSTDNVEIPITYKVDLPKQ